MAENLSKAEWTEIRVKLPPELAKYGPSLVRFFDAMVFKLRRNAHKGKWEAVPLEAAMSALEREAAEIKEALRHGSTMEILMEAADTANQALIVAEIALEARDTTTHSAACDCEVCVELRSSQNASRASKFTWWKCGRCSTYTNAVEFSCCTKCGEPINATE